MADKPLILLHGDIKTPPFSKEARIVAGVLLRKLQKGALLCLPESRPMPIIGKRCHELRIRDVVEGKAWRIIYRIDPDAILIAEVFAKKTPQTPQHVIMICKRRFAQYDLDIM